MDATLGLGGHAEALLAAHPQLTLVGLDRDRDALARSRARLAPYEGRIHLVHAVYDRMPDVLDELGVAGVDGVLFDLGVSSMQLDQAERGFAYAQDAPLDMRMDQSAGITAEDVVNTYSVPDLARVLREYGEERFALRIAQAIDRERRVAPLRSTAVLAELVRSAIPAATRRHGGHPAKRTFQALRIEVNGELDAVRSAVPAALDALRVGGRIVVLSYHSLEDRIVKQAFAALAEDRTPVGPAGAAARARHRRCGCWPAGPRPRRRRRSRTTRAPRRCGCARPSGSGSRHERSRTGAAVGVEARGDARPRRRRTARRAGAPRGCRSRCSSRSWCSAAWPCCSR